MTGAIDPTDLLSSVTWIGDTPAGATVGPAGLEIAAGPSTDWFRDPRGSAPTATAPVALVPGGDLPIVVSARVSVALGATFDAAALFVHHDHDHWIKLALERSPQGRPTLVTVRTDGWSDDGNHMVLDEAACWLRVAIDERSVALHASQDGALWHLLRYGTRLLPTPARIGLLVQSPTGPGTTGTFSDVRVTQTRIVDLRDGS